MYRLEKRSGLNQISLLVTAKAPVTTGYLLGTDLMRQKEANYHKMDTAVTRGCGSEGRGFITALASWFIKNFHYLFPNSALTSATDGTARIFLYYLMPRRERWVMIWTHVSRVAPDFEGCSTDWASVPRQILHHDKKATLYSCQLLIDFSCVWDLIKL